jgi:serine/threonine protein kinase
MQSYGGTPFFMSPEQINGASYDESVDVWAVGCVALLLTVPKRTLHKAGLLSIVALLSAAQVRDVFSLIERGGYSSALVGVVRQMLTHNAQDRPSARELLRDPVFDALGGDGAARPLDEGFRKRGGGADNCREISEGCGANRRRQGRLRGGVGVDESVWRWGIRGGVELI